LKSNIVEVSLKDEVPQKGIDFVNRLTAVYLENELFKKNQLGLKTIEFIDNQISGVSDSLKSVEGSLESYRSQNNVMDIRAKAENLTRNLDNLEQQKADLEVKLRYYRQILRTLDAEQYNDIVAPSTFGITDPLLNSLLVELSKLNQEKSGLNYSTREGNPLAEVIELKIKNNKNLIKENVSNIIEVSTIALDDFNRRIAQYNAQLNRLPRNERELVKIQRRFDFSDNVYNYLLEKRAEAGIAIASNVPNKTIIDSAMASGPVWPNKKMIYGLALMLAFGGAIGMIILKDALNDSIVSHEDLLRNTRLPFLGAIVHGSKREQDGVIANAMSPIGESFRTLRVNLQYLTVGKEVRVIGFTSSRESEGKTFCAVNLAASMAHSRKRTVLIDADMRRPRVASYFQMEADKGLSSYLIGESSVKDIIDETGIKGFDVITSGPIPPNPLDLIGQPRMGELISELKTMYDTIIIDSPPIGYVSEYVILMRYTDTNIYVVRSEYTTRYNLERVNKLYEEKKISDFNVLLNDVRYSRSNGYSYSYKYKKKKKASLHS
jgi:capsular exopolysaccharide synthesis family protein